MQKVNFLGHLDFAETSTYEYDFILWTFFGYIYGIKRKFLTIHCAYGDVNLVFFKRHFIDVTTGPKQRVSKENTKIDKVD